MKKMNILFILITLILIFGTTNVFALNFTRTAIQLNTNNNPYSWALDSSNTTYYTDFNSNGSFTSILYTNNSDITNSDYAYFSIYARLRDITTNNLISLNNINFTETCTGHTDYGATYGNNGRIVYADGTTAQIDYAQRTYLCNQWSQSGSISGSSTNYIVDLSPVISLKYINNDGLSIPCIKEGENYKCPLQSGKQLRTLVFNVSNGGYSANYRLIIQAQIVLLNEGTTDIINNNNQNSTTINNSINDTKDTITSNTIDSNTNTDNLITIPNSNGKNTILDLLMVPINFITSIVNSFSNSCVSYNLGNLLGTDLILPCINLQNILGSSLYNIIDAIFAFGMIFAFIRSVKKFIQKSLLLASDVSSEVSIF